MVNTVKKKRGIHRNFFGDFDYESKQFCLLYCCCEQMAARANSTCKQHVRRNRHGTVCRLLIRPISTKLKTFGKKRSWYCIFPRIYDIILLQTSRRAKQKRAPRSCIEHMVLFSMGFCCFHTVIAPIVMRVRLRAYAWMYSSSSRLHSGLVPLSYASRSAWYAAITAASNAPRNSTLMG